jgi:hypothetical protein
MSKHAYWLTQQESGYHVWQGMFFMSEHPMLAANGLSVDDLTKVGSSSNSTTSE